jgi:hypothetical protein
MDSRRFIVAAGLIALLGFPCMLPAAQDTPKEKTKLPKEAKEEREWKPASIPADALLFAAKLEENATPAFKDWCRSHVSAHMRSEPVSPRDAMKAVDERYPQTSEIARDAGTFLLEYLAYKDEDENQRVLAGRIREIDRATYDISREINIMRENEQRRLFPTTPRAAIGAEQRVRMDEEIRKREEQLRQYGTERQFRLTELEASRKKVNLYLKVLEVVFSRMKDVPAASIAELK